MVAFAERSSAALSATSAIPLDGLEAGLLRLVPFRFGNDGVAEDDDRLSQPSSSRSFTSSSSFLSSSDDGDVSDGDIGDLGAGGSSGGSRPKAGDDGGQDASKIAGFDHRRLAGRGSKSIRPTKAGQKQEHSAVATDKTATGPAQSPRQLPLTSPAADVAAGTKARPETRGSACGSPSAKHRKREKLRSVSGVTLPFSSDCRCDTTSSSQKPGWVRGASRDLASRGRGSPSRSRGERGTAKSRASGCWVPPPTRWGGTPIHSPSPWDDRGESFDGAAYEQANEGEPSLFRGGDAVRNGERAPEWDVEENGWGGLRGVDIFGTTGEFFRTADGRSLFAESLGNPSIHGGGGSKRRRPEIQWGGDDEYGDDSPFGGSDDRLGFLCLLGEEDYRAADRGNVEGKRLGVAARHRRTRIDARSRDGKRRAEGLSARRRIKRLEDEVRLRNSGVGFRGLLAFTASSRVGLHFHPIHSLEHPRQIAREGMTRKTLSRVVGFVWQRMPIRHHTGMYHRRLLGNESRRNQRLRREWESKTPFFFKIWLARPPANGQERKLRAPLNSRRKLRQFSDRASSLLLRNHFINASVLSVCCDEPISWKGGPTCRRAEERPLSG